MEEITSLAVPFYRSHYYSFQGEVWDLPSGQKAHIYVKPAYTNWMYIDRSIEEVEFNIYAIIGSIDKLGPTKEPIVGIRAYIDIVNYFEYEYRLDCEYDENGEVEEYIIGVYNGLVEELNTFWGNPPIEEVVKLFEKWGLGCVGYEV